MLHTCVAIHLVMQQFKGLYGYLFLILLNKRYTRG